MRDHRVALKSGLIPFALVALLGMFLACLPGAAGIDVPLIAASAVTSLFVLVSSLLILYDRVPSALVLPTALTYLVSVALLRQGGGGSQSGVALLSLLPVIWMAMYGTRAKLAAVTFGMAAVYVIPVIVIGGEKYPASGLRSGTLAVAISATLAVTIQHLVTHERRRSAGARRLAHTDHLTGLPNSRAWTDALEFELGTARHSTRPVALILLDLNSFKEKNDREGHQAGDRTLVACAAAWRAELRSTDLLARVGGDEFGVLLPGCDLADAEQLARALRRATPHVGGVALGVTVGCGDETAETLVDRADRALYEDKAAMAQVTPAAP